jgi:hypothetical protein
MAIPILGCKLKPGRWDDILVTEVRKGILGLLRVELLDGYSKGGCLRIGFEVRTILRQK